MKFVSIVFTLLAITVHGGKVDTATTLNFKTGPNPACSKPNADLTTVVDETGGFPFCRSFSKVEDKLRKTFLPNSIETFWSITTCQDLRRSLKCWVDPLYGCDAKKFRDTCRTRLKKVNDDALLAGHEKCPACLCEENCKELDPSFVLSMTTTGSLAVLIESWIANIKAHLIIFFALLVVFEIVSISFCYYCCPAQCCRSTYWLCCCFPLCPWCCFEEYCECCPCCRPCLICCLPNCCGDPPKRSYAGVELGRR
jgi:hypothetical protein